MNNFYKTCLVFDDFKTKKKFTKKDIVFLIEGINSLPYFRYFFYNLENETILSSSEFCSFLSISLSEKDQARSYLVCEYLKRAAKKNSKGVYEVLRNSKPDENRVERNLLEIILQLDNKYAKKLASFILGNIIHNGIGEGKLLGEVIKKYLEGNCIKEALAIFNDLCEPLPRKIDSAMKAQFPSISRNEADGLLEQYEFNELLETTFSQLLETTPLKTTKSLEKNLLRALKIETNEHSKIEDYSWVWRPAIEEHEQNYEFGKIKEVLVTCLRDSLISLSNKDENNYLRTLLRRYTRSRYTVFKRIALFILSENTERYTDIVIPFVSNIKNLNDYRIQHELFGLIKKNFLQLNNETQQFILTWIENGPETKWWIKWRKKEEGKTPPKESVDRFINYWKKERYWMIPDEHPSKISFNNQQKNEIILGKPADFPSWHESGFGGHVSPYTLEQLKEMSPEQLIEALTNPREAEENEPFSKHQGLSMAFEELVKGEPHKYLPFAMKLSEYNVPPVFIESFFRALRDVWAPAQLSWNDELNHLALLVALDTPNPWHWSVESRSRMRLDLARLIEGIVTNKTNEISNNNLINIRSLLITMLSDPDPNDKIESQNYSSNKDWPFIALNHTSGQVFHALIKYALYYASKHPEPAQRLDPEVRNALQTILSKETRPSMFSVFGTYLANLWYLDARWVKDNLANIFPKNNLQKHSAVWDAYLKFNNVYGEVYTELKPIYRKQIYSVDSTDNSKEFKRSKLAQHLSMVYWYGWEDIKDSKSNIALFYKKANPSLRVSFIRHIGMGLRELNKSQKLKIETEIWHRAKNLWEWRISRYRTIPSTNKQEDELATFLDWLPVIPEDVVTMEKLISKTLSKWQVNFHTGSVTEYLASQAEKHPQESLRLLHDFFKKPWGNDYFYFNRTEVRKILEEGLKKGGSAKILAGKIADLLGEYGIFEFKDIWDKSLR